MALTFHDGFETGGAEAWGNSIGSPSFVGTHPNTGNYEMRCNTSGSTAYVSTATKYPTRASFYLYIASGSTSLILISGIITRINLRLDGTILYLYDGAASKGSYNLGVGTQYRISVSTDGVGNCKVYVDSIERISSAVMEKINSYRQLGVITSCDADLYFDDYAEDETASTDDLGDIRVLAARPITGQGTDHDLYSDDTNAWSNFAENGDASFHDINDDPPSVDGAHCNGSGDTFRWSVLVDECGSGGLHDIGGSDTIEAVNFMFYYQTQGGGSNDYGTKLIVSDGTLTDDNIDDPKDPTWLDMYHADTPSGGNPWTQAYVNSIEMGMATISCGGKDLWWHETYAMVAFKISAIPFVTGTASGSIEFTADATAKVIKAGTATGAIEFTAIATAKVIKTGVASGDIEITAFALGTIVGATIIVTGTAAGSIEFVAAAVAENYNLASATGSVEVTAAAVGKVLKTATASGAIDFTAAAVSTNYNLASASGGIEFTAAALAKILKTATASAAMEVNAIAVGSIWNLALVQGYIQFVATATAKVVKTATAVGSIEFTATSTGSIWNLALVTGSIEFTASAVAKVIKAGIASGAIEVTADAIGKVLKTGTASGDIEFTATATAAIPGVAWLNIDSSHLVNHCGEDSGHGLDEALDGSDYWQHLVDEAHWFIIDLGATYNITKVRSRSNVAGYDPTDVDVFISLTNGDWGAAVATGITTWQDTDDWVEIDSTDKSGRYIKVVINTTEQPVVEHLAYGRIASPFTIFDAFGTLTVVHLATASGAIEFTATATAKVLKTFTATGAVEVTASAVAKIVRIAVASGSIEIIGTATGSIWNFALCQGHIEFTGIAVGKRFRKGVASGSIEFVATAIGNIGFTYLTPAMHAMLIDPQQGGAWLWLAEVKLPGYNVLRYARNTEDVTHNGKVFTAWNFQNTIPKLTSDGSIGRTILRITHDGSHTLEDKINALEGKCDGGYVRIIRTHVDHLDKFIEELEYVAHILKVDSNWEYVKFKLGSPNPLRRMIPMRVMSAKMCPWAARLYKGVECAAVSALPTCNGFYSDCVTRNNGPRWGGELGLERAG